MVPIQFCSSALSALPFSTVSPFAGCSGGSGTAGTGGSGKAGSQRISQGDLAHVPNKPLTT
jgi:hypothetical protein